MAWSTHLFAPIEIAGRKPLLTLRDAGSYIAALPDREQRLAHWQTAAEIVLMVGERGGDPLMPYIAMMEALDHGKPAPAREPRRKRARVATIIR